MGQSGLLQIDHLYIKEMMMETINNAPLFSFWEKAFIIFSVFGFLLLIPTMPDFGMPRWYHLFVGLVAVKLAIVNLFRFTSLTAPAMALVWSTIAVVCYGVYAGYIVQ